MLPQLSIPDEHSPVSVPPPLKFRPLVGNPRNVKLLRRGTGWSRSGYTAAQAAGLRYEDRAHAVLSTLHHSYTASPMFQFWDDTGLRHVVPDGFIWDNDRIIVFEIKSQHMPEAYWQLIHLYRPVLAARHPMHRIVCIEVCRSFDPAMPFPSTFDTIDFDSVLTYRGELGVLQWKP